MTENSITVLGDATGEAVATVEAAEVDDQAQTRYHQCVVVSERKVAAWTVMRGTHVDGEGVAANDGDADVGLYNGVNLIDQTVDHAVTQITVGDKTKLIVSVGHSEDDGSVDITPMAQFPIVDDDEEDIVPLETQTAAMGTVKHYKDFFVALDPGYPDIVNTLYLSEILVWDVLAGTEKISIRIDGLSTDNEVYVRAAVI